MKLNIKLLVAAAALAASTSSFSAFVRPGGDLGTLTEFPALFGANRGGTDVRDVSGDVVFAHDYSFTLLDTASVIGNLATTFGEVYFSGVTITSSGGLSWTKDLTNVNDTTFKFADLAAGSYTLTVDGVFPVGFNAYSGAVYATTPVPEPASMALALAGLGAVAVVARRRRPQA